MRPILTFTSALALLGTSALSLGQATTTLFPVVEYADRLVAVKIKPGKSTAASSAIKKLKGTVVRSLPQIGWQVVRLPATTNVVNAVRSFKTQSTFSNAERVIVEHPFADTPVQVNDPLAPQQYSLDRINLPLAWSLTQGDRGVVVAIVDTGVDTGHPDLVGRCLQGYDFFDDDNDPSPGTDESDAHGTHCAGIAAAGANNGIGIAGAGYNVTIMPIRGGSGAGLPVTATAAGVIYAADNGANVISMSYGGPFPSALENDAIQYAYGKGVVLVAASGNDYSTFKNYPASYDNVLAVAATDKDDLVTDFSNRGADHVDVGAPGSQILSSITRSLNPTYPYDVYDGTSMACPLVAGVASLVISAAGEGVLTNTEVVSILEDSSVDIGAGDKIAFGRVDAYRAILATPVPSTPAQISGIATLEGQFVAGTVVSDLPSILKTTDSVSATITNVRKNGVGVYGSLDSTFSSPSASSEVLTAKGTFTAKTDRMAALQVYLYNATAAKWVLVTTAMGTGDVQTVAFKVARAALPTYMTTGSLRVLVRSFTPSRLASRAKGITQIDQLQVVFGVKPSSAL